MPEVLVGLLGGTLIGATGVGSGSLLTPLLILAGYRPTVAVTTGLATLIVSKLTGAIAHRTAGNWPPLRQVAFVVGGGAMGVLAVALLARNGFAPSEIFVRRAVAISLFVTAISVWIPFERPIGEDERPDPRALFVSGAVVGAFVMLTSAGSGSLLVPILLIFTAWGVPQVAATSNLFGWIAAFLGFAFHLGQQAFDPTLFLLVIAGLVPGVIAGVSLSPWIERRSFTPALSLFTLVLALQLIR